MMKKTEDPADSADTAAPAGKRRAAGGADRGVPELRFGVSGGMDPVFSRAGRG